MLVGQCQSSVQSVLADDQSVLIRHYHTTEADVVLLTFVHPLAYLHMLFLERVAIIQLQIHITQTVLQSFLLQNLSEGCLALIYES